MEKNQAQQKNCPACQCYNPSTEHLITEYQALLKAGFNKIFGQNARIACNQIVDILADRGVTEITDIFGTRKIKKWAY